MSAEISCTKKNGNNINGNHKIIKPQPQTTPIEQQWIIKRDMPRPGVKEKSRRTS